MNNFPLVSVVIPTHNRAKFIQRAIQSVTSQTYKNYEIIVIDDGSIDNTEAEIQTLKTLYPTLKLAYIKFEINRGAQAARNEGIRLAQGGWISFLDSDDKWFPAKLEKTLTYATEHNYKVVHCGCNVKKIDGSSTYLEIPMYQGNIYKDLLKKAGPLFPGLLVNIECFKTVGLLDEKIVAHQEWDLSLQLAKEYPFGFLREPLFLWYYDGHEAISSNKRRGAEGYLQIVEKYKDDILMCHGSKILRKHYMEIASAFYYIRDYKKASFLFQLSIKYSSNIVERVINYFQSQPFMMKLINPRYLNIIKGKNE